MQLIQHRFAGKIIIGKNQPTKIKLIELDMNLFTYFPSPGTILKQYPVMRLPLCR